MNPTKAFVWAAGLGTRLRPYTHETPKPMLPVCGRPMVEYPLRWLAHVGVREVTVNTWHLGEQFEPLPERAARFGLRVALSRQPQRYEHGGDLAYARAFLDGLAPEETFLGLNGDTLFWLDPERVRAAAARVSAEAPVCLLVHETESTPLRAEGGRLLGIGPVTYVPGVEPEAAWDDFGVKVFHASIREHLPREARTLSFHGEDGLVGRLARAGRAVLVEPVGEVERAEVGTVEDYEGHEQDATLCALAGRLAALP